MSLDEFRRSHHLIDPYNKVLYCYVAKNACSTLKYHFLRKKLDSAGDATSEGELNSRLHALARGHSIASLPDESAEGAYAFCVVRNPYSRIASAFLDKFVQDDTLAAYARRLIEESGYANDIDDWTFTDFIRSLAESGLDTFNEHWMPQYIHPMRNVAYDFIPMEAFSTNAQLRRLYGDLSTNVRAHSLQYADGDEAAHKTPARRLRNALRQKGVVPSWKALIHPEIEGLFLRIFGPDIDFYDIARAAAKSDQYEPQTYDPPSEAVQRSGFRRGASANSARRPIAPARSYLISIIVPVYNVEKYIRECMESLARQDDNNFEVVVVDDGSPDSSIDIVKKYAKRFERLRIITQENRGLGGARNTGIREAEGEFVVFIDSDDVVTPDLVSKLRRRQQEGDYDVVTARFQLVSETLGHLRLPHEPESPDLDPPATAHERVLGALSRSVSCARLYRKELLTETGLGFPEKIPHEDLFFTYKVLRMTDAHAFIDDYVYSWRQRRGSLGRSLTQAHIDVLPLLRRDTYEFLDSVGALEREYAFAARRNLSLVTWFRAKSKRIDPEIREAFYAYVRSARAEILEDIERYKKLKFPGDNMLARTATLLKEAGAEDPPSLAPLELLSPSKDTASERNAIDFAFFPLRAYHLRDCIPVIEELRKKGISAAIIDTDDYRKGNEEVRNAAQTSNLVMTPFADFLARSTPIRAAVFFNDWDPLMRVISRACHEEGIETVGCVEGVNDYHDADTGRARHAYLRSRHVIVPGRFDTKYFTDARQKIHAGEVVRIRSLWENRLTSPRDAAQKKALINSNFSYGVLEDKRDLWVREAVEACLAAGFTPVLSRHPFDLGTEFSEYQTKDSFFDAVRDCDVSIQRFGSGILESLATGVPVIYFNPHGERIDKFASPEGAYLVSRSRRDLTSTLRQHAYFWSEEKARVFLELHTGLTTAEPGSRIVSILAEIAEKAPPPSPRLADALAKANYLGARKSLADEARSIDAFYGPTALAAPGSQTERRRAVQQGLISIILPVYNVEKYISECLDSLDRQIDRNFEIVVVDDGGADQSIYIVKRYADRFDRIAIYTQENLGLGGARNTGIEHANGEFIMFLDSDDTVSPNIISALRRLQAKGNYDIVSCRFDRTSAEGDLLERSPEYVEPKLEPPLTDYERTLGVISPSVACARLYRTSHILDSGVRFPNRLPHEDLFFTYKVMRGASHGLLNEHLYFWRQRPHSLSKTITKAHIDAWAEMRRDTAAFLQRVQGSEREFALAARRNLVILKNFMRKADEQGGEVLDYFEDTVKRFRKEIVSDFAIIEASDIRGVYVPTDVVARAGGKSSPTLKGAVAKRPVYAAFGEKLRTRSPRLFAALQLLRRAVGGIWRRRKWTLPVLFLLALAPLATLLPVFAALRGLVWGGAAFGFAMFSIFYLALSVRQYFGALAAQTAELQAHAARQAQTITRLNKKLNVLGDTLRAKEETLQRKIESNKVKALDAFSLLGGSISNVSVASAAANTEVREAIQAETHRVNDALSRQRDALNKHSALSTRMFDRLKASERQIGAIRYPNAPKCLVFFGHHKCASRFFRREVFSTIADMNGARLRHYEVKNPPFHYTQMDELDLSNMDFSGLGENGRDVVIFSNATERSLQRIRESASDWRGFRIIRDPRQVLISDYFHHRGGHDFEFAGWVWDQLAHDQPILRELPKEEGILYELDNISRQILEKQVLAKFDDDRIMTVRIEDFDLDQRSCLQRLAEFMQTPDIAGIHFGHTFANSESGPWQEHFTPRIKAVFKERYGQALIDIGYERDMDW